MKHSPPDRLKHVFDHYGIEPSHTPNAAPLQGLSDGFIYIIQCNEFVKIGIAKDPEARLNLLQIGNPYPLKLLKTFVSFDTKADERLMHDTFSGYYERGEWYRIPGELIECFAIALSVECLCSYNWIRIA